MTERRDASTGPRRPRTSEPRRGAEPRRTSSRGAEPRRTDPRRTPGRGSAARTAPARRPPARRPVRPHPPRQPRTLRLGSPHRRLQTALLVFAFILSVFAARLVELQGLDATAYADEAVKERLVDVALPAPRGSITDSNGVALATSVEARNVTADPTLVENKRETAAMLAPLLGVEAPTLLEKLSTQKRFVYLAKEVTPERWREIAALKLPGISSRGLPGIFSEKVTRRVYPAGQIAANVVGFVNAEGHGAGGLEDSLDERLAGRDGQATYEAGAGGRQIPLATSTEKLPVAGSDVQLTIDRDIQWKAQEELAKAVRSTGSEAGVAVVQDVSTGEILAMAAAPTFDPNDPGSYGAAVRGNRALGEAYEPGSTGKVLTASALLEEQAVRPGTVFSVPNRLVRAGKSFKDFEDHETLRMTYAGTIARSSNIGTILAAERMGLEKMHPYLAKFGIGSPTGIGFPGETSGALPPLNTWSKTTGYTLAFGQGYSVNAVQMTSAFATVANGGVRVEPSLVKGVTGPDGTYKAGEKPASTRVVSEKTAKTVALLMEGVTGEGGTAPSANIPGYRVAGKTGTAQRYNSDCACYRGYTMSFMGFAPADNPRLAVTVVLQVPKRGVGGGATAGPVFREVMSFALQTKGIPPTGAKPPKLRLFAE